MFQALKEQLAKAIAEEDEEVYEVEVRHGVEIIEVEDLDCYGIEYPEGDGGTVVTLFEGGMLLEDDSMMYVIFDDYVPTITFEQFEGLCDDNNYSYKGVGCEPTAYVNWYFTNNISESDEEEED